MRKKKQGVRTKEKVSKARGEEGGAMLPAIKGLLHLDDLLTRHRGDCQVRAGKTHAGGGHV